MHTNAYSNYPPTNQLGNQLSLPPIPDTSVWSLYTMSLCSWNPTVTLVHRAAVDRLLQDVQPKNCAELRPSPFPPALAQPSLVRTSEPPNKENDGKQKSYLKTSSSKRTLICFCLFLFIKPFLLEWIPIRATKENVVASAIQGIILPSYRDYFIDQD